MPAYIVGIWKVSCELSVRKGRPECAPIISTATSAAMRYALASRTPVKIDGSGAGRTTLKNMKRLCAGVTLCRSGSWRLCRCTIQRAHKNKS